MRLAGRSARQWLARAACTLRMQRTIAKPSWLRVVVYHRVLSAFDAASFPFDPALVDATVEEFDRELRYLKQDYEPVSCADLLESLDHGVTLPERAVLVTFDDGYRDNYEYAFPLLQTHRIPAVLFVTTSYVGADRTFWYDWLAFILAHVDQERISLGDAGLDFRLAGAATRVQAFNTTMRYLSGIGNDARLSILETVKQKYGYIYDQLDADIRALSQPLDWEQVTAMSRAGIEIGSHSETHPFLSRLGPEQLASELSRSREMIEQHTGLPVRAIAYPNGQQQDFSVDVERAVADAGYRIGFSYMDGINDPASMQRFALKRLHLSPRHDFSVFRMALSRPGLF